MEIQTTDNGMAVWFGERGNKSISLQWFGKYWKRGLWGYHDNGAKKGTSDTCFDCTLNLGYLSFSYTNWNFNRTK